MVRHCLPFNFMEGKAGSQRCCGICLWCEYREEHGTYGRNPGQRQGPGKPGKPVSTGSVLHTQSLAPTKVPVNGC